MNRYCVHGYYYELQVQIKYQVKSNVSTWAMGRKKEHAQKYIYIMHIQHYSYAYKNVAQIQKKNFKQHTSPQPVYYIREKHNRTVYVKHSTDSSSTCRKHWPWRLQRSKLGNLVICRFYASMQHQRGKHHSSWNEEKRKQTIVILLVENHSKRIY